MKNILFIANSGFNIVNFRQDLIKRLHKKKYKIFISCPDDTFIKEYLKNNSYNFLPLNFNRKSINIFSNLKLFFNLLFIYYKTRPDFVFTFTIKPNIFGNFVSYFYNYKNKQVNFITGLGTFYFSKSLFKKFILILFKISFMKSHYVFFQNNFDSEYFINNKIVSSYKTNIIGGSGIDLDDFYFKNIKNVKADNLTFLCISRLIKDKGILEYLEAAKKIKEKYKQIKFFLIGSIDKNNMSFLDSKTLKLYTTKYVQHYEFKTNIKKHLYECDCAILPSYREGTSRFLLESAAAGRPLISTDVPGCNNIVINNFNGYLCNKSSTVSLFDAIEKMINTSFEIRNKMSKNSRLLVEKNFDLKKVNNQIINNLKL